jgi:hypothetical protein
VRIEGLVERWDGTRWTALPGSSLFPFLPADLACRSGSSCYAVGSDFAISGSIPGVAHWNGRRWNRVSVGQPPDTTRAALTGVVCPTHRVCYAVGSYQDSAGSFTMALRGT